VQTTKNRLGADIVAVPSDAEPEAQSALISGNPTSFYMPASIEGNIKQVPGIKETCAQVYLRSLDSPCCIAPVAMVGYDPQRDFTIGPWVLQKTGEPLRDNQIIVGNKVISAVVGTPAKAIGQRLVFMGKPFTVATILEPTGLGTDYTVFVTMETAYNLTQDSPLYPIPVKKDQISIVLIRLDGGMNPGTAANVLEQRIPGIKALTADHLTGTFGRQLQSLVNTIFAAGGFFCVLAIVLAGSLFTLSVRQRMRELGLFRAMGARREMIFKLIVLEAACIAGAGGLIGICLGFAATWFGKDIITEIIGNMYTWPNGQQFLTVALANLAGALLTGVLGGLFPAWRIIAHDPYEAIRRGE
jgi:putative ABC transport system permease protein